MTDYNVSQVSIGLDRDADKILAGMGEIERNDFILHAIKFLFATEGRAETPKLLNDKFQALEDRVAVLEAKANNNPKGIISKTPINNSPLSQSMEQASQRLNKQMRGGR